MKYVDAIRQTRIAHATAENRRTYRDLLARRLGRLREQAAAVEVALTDAELDVTKSERAYDTVVLQLEVARNNVLATGATHCFAIDVNIDRLDDGRIEAYLPWLEKMMGLRTVEAVRARCVEMRLRGYEVFPPCDHHGPTGACLGHPVSEEA